MNEKVASSAILNAGSEDPRKAALFRQIQEICERYQFKSRGNQRTQAALAILASETCERRVRYMLSSQSTSTEDRFDPAFGEKSGLATSMILSSIVDTLTSNGLSTGLATESRDFAGTYDIVVQWGNPSLVIRGNHLIARVEVKASWGLPLPQVARYMLNPSPLVLSRVMPGTVVVLDPHEQKEFVDFATSLLTAKATRVLREAPQVIPGRYCNQCGDRECPYFTGGAKGTRMVKMAEHAFEDDLNLFFANLPKVCVRTSEVVLKLVKGVTEVPPR
jgi:hypothetical protein